LIRAVSRGRFILVTKGKAWQTPVHIEDLIEGVMLCAERGRSGEIYHLAGEEVLSVKTIVQIIAEVSGKTIPRITLPLLPVKIAAQIMGRAFAVVGKEAPLTEGKLAFFIHPKPLDIRKAKAELGYSPQVDFRKGMSGTIDWYRKHDWL
jgi:dihydroflavonol-4-reductase